MLYVLRSRSLFAVLGLLLAGLVALPGQALAQPDDPAGQPEPAPPGAAECAATGYLVSSEQEATQLREELSDRGVHRADGVPLDRVDTWVVPDGSWPVVVLDATAPVLSGGQTVITVAGQEFLAASGDFAQLDDRYVSNVTLPHLGPTIRSLGYTVRSGPCEVVLALSVDRSAWSTLAGGAGAGLAVLGGLLLVWVGRLRRGGWGRRFGWAAPLGLLAGVGVAVVLLETGLVSPFASFPWWPPVAGLGLAAVLPLTRWGRRGRPAQAPAGWPAGGWPVPVHAPLGGYRIDQLVASTPAAEVYRATRVRVAAGPDGPGEDRALLKVVPAHRYGDPAARLRIEREARVLSGLAHPHVLRLREVVPGGPVQPAPPPTPGAAPVATSGVSPSATPAVPTPTPVLAGPPVLVFEDADGAPLRALMTGGGQLSGPQAVTVVLGVLAGLGEVHRRELVHRQVRPENVWLTTGGRVLLCGFEVAVPGVEHAVAPEGGEPYASPEQRVGRVLDSRSDLWSAGVLLAELLTGLARPDPVGLPEPLARVLSRVVAEDPVDRPGSAERFAAELGEAAAETFGTDWTGRGALAGAVVAHGAVGAAAGGYALAGAAGAVTGPGAAGVAAGVAGLGAGGAAPVGALGAVGAAGGSTVVGVATAPAVPAAGGAATGAASGAGMSGPVGAVVNAAVAVLAGVAVAVGVAVVDPDPARAEPVVITPEQARVIFIRTMDEGLQQRFIHFADPAQDVFEQLLEEEESLPDGSLVEVQVGVPRDRFDYPVWFVATALIEFEDGTASVFARFERESADEPWLMTTFGWSTERLLPAPLRDEEGWLAPVPATVDLLADPAGLPERYHDWLVRANDAGEIGSDDLLTLRFDETGMIFWYTEDIPFFEADDSEDFSYEYDLSAGEVVTEPVPLVDQTVHVTFTSVIRQTTYNTPNQRAVPCDEASLFWTNDDPPGDFRWLAQDLVVDVDAWIPVRGGAAGPDPPAGATPAPEPTGTADPEDEEPAEPDPDDEDSGLEPEPVDPTDVVVEDWRYHTDNRDGQPC